MTALTTTLDRVAARQAQVNWTRVGLFLLFALPFALFYTARLIVRVAGWVGAWLWAAGMEGWAAAGPRRREDL
jgi:hypothetical protein